jgi:predicted nuclease with TOPRIM domain
MKGEATPDRIAELEELFELNRDNSKIRQLKKYVEEYELTVKRKVQLEEQARLRIQELEKLKKRVDNIKNQ